MAQSPTEASAPRRQRRRRTGTGGVTWRCAQLWETGLRTKGPASGHGYALRGTISGRRHGLRADFPVERVGWGGSAPDPSRRSPPGLTPPGPELGYREEARAGPQCRPPKQGGSTTRRSSGGGPRAALDGRRRRRTRGVLAHWPRRGRCHVGGSGASVPWKLAVAAAAASERAASCFSSLESRRREAAAGGMEKSRMNLPKGPDTLCFDKDEFMKVRAGGSAPWSRAVGGLPSFALRGLSSGLSCALPGPRPPRTGPRRGPRCASQ